MFQNTNDYKKYIYYFLRSVVFVINLILNIFCLFLFVVSICRIYWGPEKILDIFRIDYYKVASGSMEPLIKKEDIVVVKKIPDKEKENIVIGDIVIFQNKNMTDGIPIIHRVVSNNTKLKTIETKGDNNQKKDSSSTKYDGILAKHIFTISYFKTFLCFFFLILFIFSNMPFLLKNLFLSSKKKNNLYK
ncbi:signal peptidase I [Candidatus Phytoplasma ziziphi]|uniref:Signal peptidase I n=1 Tax=Ziziphus jujuba witches'-broom phytoplasma TaxID=135727 RepID=A0A660HLQ7_ZIZJU|nr:signal peptidase I [Candidatus Phytoplasma ziziphi]AYJ00990.1 signal peptidase I [Candidatus Phytoplasma ziziphi]